MMDYKSEGNIVPKVSVCMVTYNNAAYITQALESILMQQTNFRFEVIVTDDASTDATQQKVAELQTKHKEGHKIKYKRNKVNLSYVPNLIKTLKRCQGQYIAFLDSDDYWTDPLKLQKQVDFLENNPEYVICFHDVTLINQNDIEIENNFLKVSEEHEYTAEDIIKGGIMPTATICFRNCIDNYQEKVYKRVTINGDTFLFALLAKFGKAKFLPEINNSIRRIHERGIWGGLSDYEKLKNGTNTYRQILKVVDSKQRSIAKKVYYMKSQKLLMMHLQHRRYGAYIKDKLNFMRL